MLDHRKISHALGSGLKKTAIDLVRDETVEVDQATGDNDAAFIRQELAGQMTTAARE